MNKTLPTAQQLERGDPHAFKQLLLAIQNLQNTATPVDELIRLGIVRKTSSGVLYDPNADESTAFDTSDNTKPDAPTGLAVTTTSNIAFVQWTVPYFQPILTGSEVWVLTAPAFREDIDYSTGEFVTYASTVYIFTSGHAAGVWDAGDVATAGAGDLIPENAMTRHSTQVSSAIVPLDLVGGTAYFWVRTISDKSIASDFSSLVAVSGAGKTMPGALPLGVEICCQTSPGIEFLEANGPTVNIADYAELFALMDGNGLVFTEGTKLAAQYGDGNGSTTFSLPDYRGRVPVGLASSGTFSTIGSVGGAETHTLTTGEMPSHTHTVTDTGHSHTATDPGHGHAITDPGHDHDQQVDSDATAVGSAGTFGSDGANDTTVGTTASDTTGITIDSATTGITVNSNTTGLTVDSATTGITIASTGGGGAHNILQPYYVTRVWIKAKN